MSERQGLEDLFVRYDFQDFRWIDADSIIVAEWVRFRCLFGCSNYGKCATCPPNTPPVEECRRFFAGYRTAVIFHLAKQVEKPEDRKPWSREVFLQLSRLEREVFLAGYHKAFLVGFDSCGLCAECGGTRQACKNPKQARPGADALAVDVFGTVRAAGYPIQVLKDYGETMNRYAFLMIE